MEKTSRYDSLSKNQKSILNKQRGKAWRGFLVPGFYLLRARQYSFFFTSLVLAIIGGFASDFGIYIISVPLELWLLIGLRIYVLVKGREMAFNTSQKNFEEFTGVVDEISLDDIELDDGDKCIGFTISEDMKGTRISVDGYKVNIPLKAKVGQQFVASGEGYKSKKTGKKGDLLFIITNIE